MMHCDFPLTHNFRTSWQAAVPPFSRLRVFVDGENLVFRYQSMVAKGWIPRTDEIIHIPDVLVWHPTLVTCLGLDEVHRATLYTYAVGDDLKIKSYRDIIKKLWFQKHDNSTLSNLLTPMVFKKKNKAVKAKGVDIQITVDVLNHVYRDNVDAIWLLSGDGDYLPVVEEVLRCGKQCYISSLSDGLNEKLREVADRYISLDDRLFTSGPMSNKG